MQPVIADPIVATQVNGALKKCASGCALSATEASSPQVREALVQISQEAIRRQYELSQLMEQQGWYVPTVARHEDIQQLLPQLSVLTQGLGLAAAGLQTSGANAQSSAGAHPAATWMSPGNAQPGTATAPAASFSPPRT